VLCDHGANANTENDLGETPLHMVSRGKYDSQGQGVSTARLLLERGVDVNARDKRRLDLATLGSFQREGRGHTASSRAWCEREHRDQ
jgi:ankyrin repeat protein